MKKTLRIINVRKILALSFLIIIFIQNCSSREGYIIENRKLTWDDFEGGEPLFAFSTVARTTTYLKLAPSRPYKVKAWCEFVKESSFVKEKVFDQNDNVVYTLLEHEQGHYDICILYSRILRKKISSTLFSPSMNDLRIELTEIFQDTFQEMKDMNMEYDNDTGHGHYENEELVFPLDKQKYWTKRIASLLNQYWYYSTNKEIDLKFVR
ncbi:MAG: DUF922 domain-containing protein [Leptospiraceae bacterium]|nr:DUF922 domain-containing protein [Leptospiraceae bacterium]MCP5495436.1 DUF922 domain-containing protein [Leptospiraceae bacterium]